MNVQDMVYRFYKIIESVHPGFASGISRPDTETILNHLNKAQNMYVSQKYAKAGGFKMKSEAFNAFYDEFKTIVTESNITLLDPLANTAHYGKLGALPSGYMHYLRSDSSVTRTDAAEVGSKQMETLTLAGSSGTANILAAGGINKLITFNTNLSITAANFYITNAAYYSGLGVDLSVYNNKLVFTAQVPGVPFTTPSITNVNPDITGRIQHGYSRTSYFHNQLGTFADLNKVMTTATNKPIFHNPIILLHKDSFWVVTDSYTTVNSVNFIYIKQPKKMTLNTPSSDETTTCELSEFIHEDIVTLAVQDFISSKAITNNKEGER